MQVPNLPIVALGNLLTNSVDIVPLTGDVFPENNASLSAQVIIGSYDPNDKMESRGGQILITDFSSQDYLYYTVRFENTGTASAVNVKITDVLDDALDASSLRMVDASHDYILDRTGYLLSWKFDDIQLPATAQNSELAKGYVVFKVKPNPGYAVGNIIPNTASIFFDFNPAVVTNTFNSEFVSALGNNEFTENGFSFYPNPANENLTVTVGNQETIKSIVIVDLLGKTVFSESYDLEIESTVTDISGISSGVYIIQVTTGENVKIHKKLVVK